MKRIVSGIQATGNLHLGNYLGSIKNWVKLQHQYETLIFVADLHSITIAQDPENLRQSIRYAVAAYIASGIDEKKVKIFTQSQIFGHAELGWLFNCITPIGWLNRMTQFKEKAGQDRENASTGLYTYPVLMAADILLYKADLVPVGEDQKQHLELTRDIAAAFNRKFNVKYFNLPEPYIGQAEARIMSLRDGTKKMSKSDDSDLSRINLLDSEDQIIKKIQKAKTDSLAYISYDKDNRPEVTNLLNIYSILANQTIEEIVSYFSDKSTSQFKKELADLVVDKLLPIGKEMKKILDDPTYIDTLLSVNKDKVLPIAEKTIREVKELFGFLS